MLCSFIVTTSGCHRELEAEALEVSKQLGIVYIPRKKHSIQTLREETQADGILIVEKKQLVLHYGNNTFFFHPGMAKLRILNLQRGKIDPMIEAMALKPGHKVLDCTLGLGSDAIVASYLVGEEGRVVGLEDSSILSYMVAKGLQKEYSKVTQDVKMAMERIQVNNTEHLSYLRKLPDNSFDVVYFDPMFRIPQKRSSAMAPLRFMVNANPISMDALEEAKRVAAERVVIKERRESPEFKRLGIQKWGGGKYSPIAYGIIPTKGV